MSSDPPTRPVSSRFAALLFAIGCWFGAWGIQMVIFQWLVVEVLRSPPALVGTAQMSMNLPSLLFLLVGGVAADRIDPRRLLMGVHLAAGLLVGVLALVVVGDVLSYPLLLAYAFGFGTLQAFGLPARDTQLSDVVAGSMSRAVAGTLMIQHGSQVVGAFCAGAAGWIGGGPILALQCAVVIAGAWPASKLPGRPAGRARRAPISAGEIGAGIVEVVQSPVLRPVLILAVSTGFFFVGPFLVILPLMVRDVYGGGAAEMGVLTAMFPLGAVLGGFVILGRGGIRRSGRALLAGQVSAAACIASIALGLPFAGTVMAVLGWGVAGAVFINAGRTLFQTHASESHRARVLSVYTLGVMGSGPLGSLFSGLVAEPLGLEGTLALDAGLALVVALGTSLLTGLLREA